MTHSFTSTIRTDLLDREETETPKRISVDYVYDLYVEPARANSPPLKSLAPAKTLDECFTMIGQAITQWETLHEVIDDAKLKYFGYEDPDKDAQLEAISILPTLRQPARLDSGPATKGQAVREIKPHLREETIDPLNHNYRLAILGQLFDNWVDFTCWARTNKSAYSRALWFEDLIQEYAWYFTATGVSRIIIVGHKQRVSKKIGDNVIYGFPVEVFIQTEKITQISEKALEQLIIEIGLSSS